MSKNLIQIDGQWYMAAKEFAEEIGVHISTVRKWELKGKIKTKKLGVLKLVKIEQKIDAYKLLKERLPNFSSHSE